MHDSSTPADRTTTQRALDDAFFEGWKTGMLRAAIMTMLPDEKNKGAFRRREIADRMSEYARNAYELRRNRKYDQYWPKEMPGGWPIPPEIPSNDENTYWPEVNGWPCPPPQLRGDA